MESNILARIRKTRGFTLIELLIVIAIIAILSVAFLPTLRGGQSKARDSAKIALVNDMVTAIEKKISDGGWTLPVDGGVAPAKGVCLSDYSVSPGSDLATALGRVPQTFPAISGNTLCNGNEIFYNDIGSNNSYILAIGIENESNANVKKDETSTKIKETYNSVADVITATNGAVNGGDGGKYYYIIAK